MGKTFIVRSFFKDKFDFFATGILEGTYEEELKSINDSLKEHGHKGADSSNWMDAFSALAALMAKAKRKKRCVIFLDDISCFDTPNSGFYPCSGPFLEQVCIAPGQCSACLIRFSPGTGETAGTVRQPRSQGGCQVFPGRGYAVSCGPHRRPGPRNRGHPSASTLTYTKALSRTLFCTSIQTVEVLFLHLTTLFYTHCQRMST